jgi:predicted alpha/beta hydrolase
MATGLVKRWSVGLLVIAFVLSGCASPSGSENPAGTASPPPSVAATVNPDASISPTSIDPARTCTEDGQLCTAMAVATWAAVPFTPLVRCSDAGRMCRLVSKIFAPTATGRWPLIVLVGASGPPDNPDSYVDPLAEQLAGRGFVVFRANFREGRENGGGYPATFADIACAVGFARRAASMYGASSSPLTLVGHSFAGWITGVVALTPMDIKPAEGSCMEVAGSLRPDRWAGLAGALRLPTAEFKPDDYAGDAEWLGGDREQVPATWAAADPFVLAPSVAAAQRIPVDLIVGANDDPWLVGASTSLDAAMHKVGWPSQLTKVANADHDGILSSRATLDALMALAGGN